MAFSVGDCETQDAASAWYKSTIPLRVDLVGDLAGKELFVIHGDALMLYCITRANVDLQDGFQLLHAVHAVESLLFRLKERGCNFHIVWFQDHEELCLPRQVPNEIHSRYLLTRTILIYHLQRRQHDGVCKSFAEDHTTCIGFQSLNDSKFKQYMAVNAIRFFLCLDGPAFRACTKATATAFLSIARHLATRGYSLAFINDIEFVSSGVRSSVISPTVSRELTGIILPERTTRKHDIDNLLYQNIQIATLGWTPWEDGHPLSEREMMSFYALCYVAKMHEGNPQESYAWFSAFITHLVILRRLPLSQRTFSVTQIPNKVSATTLLSEFSSVCLGLLVETAPDLKWKLKWDLFDLLDGRLLRYVLGKNPRLPKPLAREVNEFAAKMKQVTSIDLSSHMPSLDITGTIAHLSVSQKTAPRTIDVTPNYGVLPFSHPILDNYLKDVRLEPTLGFEPETHPTIFKEVSHWHNARVSVNSKHIPLPKTGRQLRTYYKQMAAVIAYSASLTNASGKMIDPEVIVVTEELGTQPETNVPKYAGTKESKRPETKGTPGRSGKQTGSKKSQKKSGKELALEAAQKLQEERLKAKANDALVSWEQQCRSLDKEPDLIKRYLKTIKYLNCMNDSLRTTVRTHVSLYACNTLASMLTRSGPRCTKNEDISALVWSTIQGVSRSDLLVSSSAAELFKSLARSLQLPADFLSGTLVPTGQSLPFLVAFDSRGTTPSLTPANVEFQLQHCGPFLERSFDPAPDSRVPFNPDAWQRKVLDAIDADKSLFVVAPTSAGKTFISFYAMKGVLKESNDGVLVYVAPTKALVNQIAAEIQARYTKNYGHEARSVWAIHTRDYRVNNPGNCQILVTVPHVLQIMLMAPSNAESPNSWSRRVKRIIFDEVHCIGQADDGVIWEQLLLLAPCPIIALSATVGNPLEFKAWLEESERAKGNRLEMIVHSTRYSDLRKFFWHAPHNFSFKGLETVKRLPVPGLDDGSDAASRFFYIHPVASLINRNRGTIQDLSLEPRDCLLLWKSMNKHQTGEFTLDPCLDPREVLPELVRKADVVRYETMLKDGLHSWMNHRGSPFEAVRKDLQPRFRVSPMSRIALKDQLLPLLADLRTQGALPAILFNYDRVNCEDFAFRLLKDLTQTEDSFKASDPEWKKKMAKFEQWKTANDRIEAVKKKASKSKSKGKRDDDDVDNERLQDDPSIWTTFDPNAPLSQFSFADETKLTKSELEEMIYSLRFKEINPDIVEALRRGIGVHHAGMNRKYRQTVEVLFRKGFITVVFATGTLALGLNMPCKTVVFFGDSLFLTALNYHQAAGRAGRRGFDLLGNVVFVGMSNERVFEIMSSRLPDLRGHFPLSTTLVLRTLGLLCHTKNSDYSVRAVQSLLSQTRLYLGGPADKMAIKHHLRFSIEYLRRQHLLDRDGTPLNFAGLVGHLYFTEDAVFAFHALLKEGYFHSLCSEFLLRPDDVLLRVVLILSHIFCRIPTRGSRKGQGDAVRHSPSVVLLPPLPDNALQILRQHNKDTLDIFRSYVGTFVEQYLHDKSDRCLPFTEFDVGATEGDLGNRDLLAALTDAHHLPPTKIRSPFAALSGFDDHSFGSIHELCSTVRSGVFLEESAIPFIPIYPDDTEGVAWNAYIYDFFKHGDMEALVRDNHVKRGDVWFHLRDFSLVLATIVTSLNNFLALDAGGDEDLAMLDVQDANDAHQDHIDAMDADDNLAAETEAARTANNGGLNAATMYSAAHKKSKKAKIADSWEDEDSLDENGESGPEADLNSKGSHPKPRTSGASKDGTGFAALPAWEGDGGKDDLVHVLHMFQRLQESFDEKFRNIWA